MVDFGVELSQQLQHTDQHLLAFKLISKCKVKEERREAFISCHSQLFQLLKMYEKRYTGSHDKTNHEELKALLFALSVLLGDDENTDEWANKYGVPFVQIIFNILLQKGEKDAAMMKVHAARTLRVAATLNDSLRIHMRELRGLKPILDMMKHPDAELKKTAAGLLEAFSLNETNRACVPELNGITIALTLLDGDMDQSVTEATLCVLNTLMVNNESNTRIIVEKCPIKPLWQNILESLAFSSTKSKKDTGKFTRTIHEPEFIPVAEKLLNLMEKISQDKTRVLEIYQVDKVNVLQLLFSMICFLYSSTSKNYGSCIRSINSIIALLIHLSEIEPVRRDILAQFTDNTYNNSNYFYGYVEDRSINGAQLILHQFRNRNISGAQSIRQTRTHNTGLIVKTLELLARLAKYEPEAVFKIIDYSEGISNCIFYLRASQLDAESRIHVTDVLRNMLTPTKNRAKLDEEVTQEIVEAVFHVLQITDLPGLSKLQWRALQILRYVDITEVSWMNQCLTIMRDNIPSYRLCDWLLQSDYKDPLQEKLFFTFLETLKNLLLLEKVSGYDFAHLGISRLMVDIMVSNVYKEIVLFILANTTATGEMRDHFVRSGGLDKLITLLNDNDDNSVMNALKVVFNVCDKHPHGQRAFAESGGLDAVLLLLRKHSQTVDTSKSATLSPSNSPHAFKLQIQILTATASLLESEGNARFATAFNIVDDLLLFLQSYSSRIVLAVTKCMKQISHLQANKMRIAKNAKLVTLLSSENTDILETVCNILSNVATDETCRQSLVEKGVVVRLQELVESDEEYISMVAQMALNHFKSVDSKELKRAIDKLSLPVVDFETKKKQIETQYVRTYESMIQRSSIRASVSSAYESLSISINWEYFDKLPDDQKHSALHLLKKNMWNNLRQSICMFCDQSAAHGQGLLYSVKRIVVQFGDRSFVQYEASGNEQSTGRHNIPSAGTLYYTVGYDEVNSLPVTEFVEQLNAQFEGAIKKMRRASILSNTYSERVLSTPQQDILEKAAVDPIGVLKKLAKEAVNGTLQLQAVAKLISNAPYYVPTATDDETIKRCTQQILLYEENFLKGYRVIKVNKNGLKQERYILVTDKSYYTVKYDFGKKEYDKKHTKRHNLKDIFLLDLGHFENKNDRPFVTVFTNEKASKNRTFSLARKPTQLNFGMIEEAELQRVRPSTDHCYANIMIPPINLEELERGKTKKGSRSKEAIEKDNLFIHELSWLLFAASSHVIGVEIFEPFEDQVLEKPTGNLTSFIYNKFKFGML